MSAAKASSRASGLSAFRDGVLFLEAGLQLLEVYRIAGLRALRRSSEILDRPRNWLLQLTRCPQWPIRISQEFAGADDRIRLTSNHDVLSLNGRCDHPHRTGQDAGFPADLLRKRRLITRSDRNLRTRHIASRRAIDQVRSKCLQLAGELNGLLNIPPAIDPIARRNAYEQRCALWPRV